MSVDLAPGYTVTAVHRAGGGRGADRLGFELGGRITEVLVEEGDVVDAGTVLAPAGHQCPDPGTRGAGGGNWQPWPPMPSGDGPADLAAATR